MEKAFRDHSNSLSLAIRDFYYFSPFTSSLLSFSLFVLLTLPESPTLESILLLLFGGCLGRAPRRALVPLDGRPLIDEAGGRVVNLLPLKPGALDSMACL